MPQLSPSLIQQHIAAALAEDLGTGDVTTESLVDAAQTGTARIVARQPMTVAGLEMAQAVFHQLDPEASIAVHCEDGSTAESGEAILTVRAKLRALLSGERTALNYLQRLSGVATQAARYVEAVAGTGVLILDTRKTTPGWRALEKYAVKCGGARNHRRGLDDMAMIKDNHLAALDNSSLADAIASIRERSPELKIEVEAETVAESIAAVEAGADIVLLDNMPVDEMREAVQQIDGAAHTEASGGITLETIREVAETSVNYISVGALTHSAVAVDMAMELES